MSDTNRNHPSHRRGKGAPRRITVRGQRRTPPDLRKLSRTLLELAAAQAEADAEAATQAPGRKRSDDNAAASPPSKDGE